MRCKKTKKQLRKFVIALLLIMSLILPSQVYGLETTDDISDSGGINEEDEISVGELNSEEGKVSENDELADEEDNENEVEDDVSTDKKTDEDINDDSQTNEIILEEIDDLNVFNLGASYNSDYRYWSQGFSDYQGMREVGCWIVAQAKLLYETGVDRSSGFNPDSYYNWQLANGHIYSSTNLNQVNGGAAPSTYASLKGKTLTYMGNWAATADQLWFNINAGYHTIVKVNGGSHYVMLANDLSKQYGTLYCYDSFSDKTVDMIRPLSRYGTWTSSYVYRNDSIVLDKQAPTISNIRVTDINKDGYTVTCNVADNIGVAKVSFPSWNTDIHRGEDANWLTGTISGNTASIRVNISSLKSGTRQGNYMTHIYAYDAAGNVAWASIPSTYIDRTPPEISDVRITNRDSTGYTVNCVVTDNTKVNRVQFPTWTLKTDSSGNEQDDLAANWQTSLAVQGTLSELIPTLAKQASYRVKFSDHNYEGGYYRTHIYAYDDFGNSCKVVVPDINTDIVDTKGPEINSVVISDFDETGFTVTVEAKDDSGIDNILVKVNLLAFTEDKSYSKVTTLKDGKYIVRFDTLSPAQYGNLYGGSYQPIVYAYDAFGNVTEKKLDFISSPIINQYTIKVGDTFDIEKVLGISGFRYYHYELGDGTVISLDDKGMVTGLRSGKSVIVAIDNITAVGPTYMIIVEPTSSETETKPISSLKLNKSAEILTQGSSITLTATIVPSDTTNDKTITWSSSDKAIATVSNGKITAVKAGTATIMAKTSNGKTATCNVIVTTPLNLTLSVASASSMKISWTTGAGITAYEVWYATSENGKYQQAKVTTDTSYTQTDLDAGTTYYYKIRPYKTISDTKVYGDYTSVKSKKLTVPTPMNVKLTNSSANSLKVSWTKVAGASGYEIYRATSKSGTYKKIETITSGTTISYTNKSLTNGKTYYYKVCAYKTVDASNKYSDYCSIQSKKVNLAKSAVTATAKSKSSIKLSWKKVSGATKYEVYRATSKNGTYKKIKTTSSLIYINTKLKSNKSYYYKVKAVQTVSKKTYKSAYSTVQSAKTAK